MATMTTLSVVREARRERAKALAKLGGETRNALIATYRAQQRLAEVTGRLNLDAAGLAGQLLTLFPHVDDALAALGLDPESAFRAHASEYLRMVAAEEGAPSR